LREDRSVLPIPGSNISVKKTGEAIKDEIACKAGKKFPFRGKTKKLACKAQFNLQEGRKTALSRNFF